MNVDHQQLLRVAIAKGLSAYDASYLHIARVMGLPLVTFDEELREAASRLAL